MNPHLKAIARPNVLPAVAQKVIKNLTPCENALCDFILLVTGVDLRRTKIIQ